MSGQSGTIGSSQSYYNGPTNVSVLNQGAVLANVAGGTITMNAQPLVNTGTLSLTNGGSLTLNYLASVTGLYATGGGTLTLNGNWTNNEPLTLNSGSLNFNGNWANNGTINATNTSISLGGNYSTAGLGGLNLSGGTVYLSGTLNNSNASLVLDGFTRESWYLNYGNLSLIHI